MDLYLLAELKTISLKITTVDMKRPPADFRSNFEVRVVVVVVVIYLLWCSNRECKVEVDMTINKPCDHQECSELMPPHPQQGPRDPTCFTACIVTRDTWPVCCRRPSLPS